MAFIGAGDGLGHMDQVGIYQDQIPGPGDVLPVIKEEHPLPFHDVEDFVLGMEVLHPHIKFPVTDHLF